MKFTASEDFSCNKKLSASWLAAMHKVSKGGKLEKAYLFYLRILGPCAKKTEAMGGCCEHDFSFMPS